MTIYGARILDANGNPPAFGAPATIRRTQSNIPAGDPVVTAYFMLKQFPGDADGAALIAFSVDGNEDARGRVEVGGGGEVEAVIRLEIIPDDYDGLEANRWYHYDIKVETESGLEDTMEVGSVFFGRTVRVGA